MKVEINLVEVASELAHNATADELVFENVYSEINSEEDLYEEDDNGDTVYTEVAQDVFNNWYDYFYTVIENLSDEVKQEKEKRVYLVSVDTDNAKLEDLSDNVIANWKYDDEPSEMEKEFISEAEKEGTVFSLEGFQNSINGEFLDYLGSTWIYIK